jgi:hypothetical protein
LSLDSILDKVVLEEYGGCNPRVDNPCILKARVSKQHRTIEVFVVGKWRVVRGYWGSKYVITNKKILADMEKTVRINTGSHVHSGYDPSVGTFHGKEIRFDFIPG